MNRNPAELHAGSTQRALVLSPHPDDESLGCGGTLALITAAGGLVDVLYMTSGENGVFPGIAPTEAQRRDLAFQRQQEARRACEILGVQHVAFLPGNDGSLKDQPHLADPIVAALKAHDYRSVFCPWPKDGHADHTATYGILLKALQRFGGNLDLFFYEIWTPMPANLFIGIDTTVDRKMEAFKAHQSQSKLLTYADGFEGLTRYRALFCPPARHAEAFFNTDRAALVQNQNLPWESTRTA